MFAPLYLSVIQFCVGINLSFARAIQRTDSPSRNIGSQQKAHWTSSSLVRIILIMMNVACAFYCHSLTMVNEKCVYKQRSYDIFLTYRKPNIMQKNKQT